MSIRNKIHTCITFRRIIQNCLNVITSTLKTGFLTEPVGLGSIRLQPCFQPKHVHNLFFNKVFVFYRRRNKMYLYIIVSAQCVLCKGATGAGELGKTQTSLNSKQATHDILTLFILLQQVQPYNGSGDLNDLLAIFLDQGGMKKCRKILNFQTVSYSVVYILN